MTLNITEERKGEAYIVAEAILWGLFPILALKSFNSVPPVFSAALCQLTSILFLAWPVAAQGGLARAAKKDALYPILGSTLLVGVAFYSLVFIASRYSDPVSLSILLLLEVPATYIVLKIFGKEHLKLQQMIGGFFVLTSSALVLFHGTLSFRLSDLLVVLAVFIAPMGNYYNKEARKFVSAITFVCARNFLSAIFLLILSFIFEPIPTFSAVSDSMYYIIPNGIFVFGFSKILWVEGVFRIPIGKAISLNSIFPVVTMLGSFLFLDYSPTLNQVLALLPGIFGVYLLTKASQS